MTRKRVAVVFGGRSAEHEISILSARFVFESLDRALYEPLLIGIDKTGRWLLQDDAVLLQGTRDPRLQRLNASMPNAILMPHPSERSAELQIANEGSKGIDVVFPVLHGPMGEDGSIQGLLTLAQVPFVGAGVLGSAVGMDKDVMKRLLAEAGLPLVPHVVIRTADFARSPNECVARVEALGFPLFVKPANLGSSVGVTRVTRSEEVRAALEEGLSYDLKVVAEAGVPNVRELECAILGNDAPIASCVGEIVVDHPDGFYSYAAKYVDERGVTTVAPADIPAPLSEEVRALSLRTFRALECEGLARVDFFLGGDGRLFVNEINTMPGFTAISMYPKLWALSGVGATELTTRLIELAIERADLRRKLRTTQA